MTTIATHNAKFHADDVYAVATLRLLYEEREGSTPQIVRTRDEAVINQADIVVDVGRVYDPQKKRFDHHQGEIEPRENGIPYASFGLIWREYGSEVCGNERVAELVEEKLVQQIDAGDEGVELVDLRFDGVDVYDVSGVVESFVPTWQESDLSTDEQFLRVCDFAMEHLRRVISHARAIEAAREDVEQAYHDAEDKRIVVLDQKRPWKRVLLSYDEPLFVVYPVETDGDGVNYNVQTVPKDPDSFENRKDLPEEWAGKEQSELREITGVDDIVFVHRGQFLAVAESKESALKLAQMAVEEEG